MLADNSNKGIALILSALMIFSCCSCASNTADTPDTAETQSALSAEGDESQEIRHFIIDTDTGADDACALIYAAKADNVVIEGVTVLAGNVDLEQGTQNALMALELAGSDAPVYKGADHRFAGDRIEAYSVFGKDGMGDADLIHPSREAEDGDAIDFILDTVKNNPGEIEILCIGPATNIAMAINKDPETMKQVKMIWSMGTPGLGPGNATPVSEFNVYSDADAYKMLLDSGCPVTIIGLDMCDGEAQWTDANFDTLSSKGELGKFITDSFGSIREFYRGNGSETVMNCDPVAAMCAIEPGFMNATIQCDGSCILTPGETYGQVIFYKEGFTYDVAPNDFDYNVTLATDVDKEEYFTGFLKAIE